MENRDRWLRVELDLPGDLADGAGSFLMDLGSAGLEERPGPGEEEVTLVAYLPEEVGAALTRQRLERYLAQLGELGFTLSPRAVRMGMQLREDWVARFREGFVPFMAGRRIMVVPPWQSVEETGDRLVLVLEPRMAFGTGLHETTQLCVEAIEGFAAGRADGWSMLDVGCGTAILAMAASRLGAGRVVATDNDPEALCEAARFLRQNYLAEEVELSGAPPEKIRGGFDLVVANIISTRLLPLVGAMVGRLATGGALVLSGILAEEESDFTAAASTEAGRELPPPRVARKGEWLSMSFGP